MPRHTFPTRNRIRTGKPTKTPRGGDGKFQTDPEAKRVSQALLRRPKYLQSLKAGLDELKVHPSIIVALMHYAWGKPKEQVEVKEIVPVRIQHVYEDDDDKDDQS